MKQIHAHQREKRNVRAETQCIARRYVYTLTCGTIRRKYSMSKMPDCIATYKIHSRVYFKDFLDSTTLPSSPIPLIAGPLKSRLEIWGAL